MFFQHVAHGLLILIVVFFMLPALFSIALSTMAGGKSSTAMANRLLIKGLHAICHAVVSTAEATANCIAEQYPEQENWLKPTLRFALTATLVLGGLYLVSALSGG